MVSFEERFGDGCRILRREGLLRILNLLSEFFSLFPSHFVLVLRNPCGFFFGGERRGFFGWFVCLHWGLLLGKGTVRNVVVVMFFYLIQKSWSGADRCRKVLLALSNVRIFRQGQ